MSQTEDRISPTRDSNVNGWNEHARLVLSELERLTEDFKQLAAKVDGNKDDIVAKVGEINTSIAVLRSELNAKSASSGRWAGAIAAGVVSIIFTLLLKLLKIT